MQRKAIGQAIGTQIIIPANGMKSIDAIVLCDGWHLE
jgi:hypothetical protein